jgi:TM2 domain family protein
MPLSKIFFDPSKFPDNQFFMLSEKLSTLTQKQVETLSFYNFKNPNITAVAGVFLGFFGVDRFYIEDTMQGIIKAVASFFFLIIGAGIEDMSKDAQDFWGLMFLFYLVFIFVDIFLCYFKCKNKNLRKFYEILELTRER